MEVAAAGQNALQLVPHQNGPALQWPNTNGVQFQLLRSSTLFPAEWNALTDLTGDGKELRWTDESAGGANQFYRWRIERPESRSHKFQTALNSARSMAGARGAIAAILSTNGIWIGTSGVSDSTSRAQVEPQMRFGIGSITKTFVAATILQLADEKRLSLDDPLARWVPEVPKVTNTITIRQLLDHTSGVYDFFDSSEWYDRVVANPGDRITTAQVLRYIDKPYFPPGTAFHYSNTGYLLLGLVIEHASGRELMEEFRERFFRPLGLRSFYLAPGEQSTGELIHPHGNFYNGFKSEVDIASVPGDAYFSSGWSAGALFGIIQDIARWAEALWSGSLHSPAMFAEMIRWNPVSGAEKYGLGVWSESTSKGEFYVHSGHVPGYRTFAGYSPSRKTTVVLFMNSDSPVRPGWLSLVNAL